MTSQCSAGVRVGDRALLMARIRKRVDPLILAGDAVGDLFDAASVE
jgi:hypothetical protein